MDPVQLAGFLESVPGLAASAQGRGPLRVTWLLHDRPQPPSFAVLARMLAAPLGVRLTLLGLDVFTRRLADLAAWHDGTLTRDLALTETGGAHGAELDRAAATLRDRLLAEEDGWLVLRRPVLAALSPPGQRVRDWLRHLDAASLGIIATNLGAVDLPSRHGKRIDLIEAMLRRRDVLDAVVARMPKDSARILDLLLVRGSVRIRDLGIDYAPPRTYPGSRSAPLEWLRNHALVDVDYGAQVCHAFLDVVFARNGGRLFTTWQPQPPGPGRAALSDVGLRVPPVLEQLAALLELWGADPAEALTAGGLGVRPVRSAAKQLGLPAGTVGLLATLAVRLGLLGQLHVGTRGRGRSSTPILRWSTTDLVERWADEPATLRWAHLVQAWLDDPRLDEGEGLPERVTEELGQPLDVVEGLARTAFLDLLAEQPADRGIAVDALIELASWRLPGLLDHGRVSGLVAAARVLGLVPADGPVGLTGVARALRQGLAALDDALPEGRRELVVQADLTVITPPDADADLTAELARYADLESDAGARVWRLSETRIARALDAGGDAEGIVAFLRAHATAELPQNVTYLLADAARRHGRVRGGSAGSYLRSDDPALLSAAVAARAAKLRLLAPSVAVSPLPRAKLLAALRDRGISVVAEDEDGTTARVAPKAAVPVTSQRSGATAALPELRAPDPDLRELAAALLADDRPDTGALF
jgi:hypothetical protein